MTTTSDGRPGGASIGIAAVARNVERLAINMGYVIQGKPEVIHQSIVCLLAEGHLLLEDVPGTGKTSMARALATSLSVSWNRIQFTPDLLPSDVTGVSIYNQTRNEFEFKHGPVFANIVLADEINRASPKTQSALLEVMEEGTLSTDAMVYPMPRPFMVVATQNPIDMEGTHILPEAQLDRFLMKLTVGYPSAEAEAAVLRTQKMGPTVDQLLPVLSANDIMTMIDSVRHVEVAPALEQYIVAISAATRTMSELRLGVSPRGSLALLRASRAHAAAIGRAFVIPEDVKYMAPFVLAHRIILQPDAELQGRTGAELIARALQSVPVPAAPTPEFAAMTKAGLAALLAGVAAITLGLWLQWTAFDLIGVGLLAIVLIGVLVVSRPSPLSIDRAIQPPRVPKGSPAIAVLTFANKGRRTVGVTVANQPFGGSYVRTVIPRLRRGERGLRTYRLPTRQRGIFDVGPVEVTRRDPFELFRTSRRHGAVERIWVYPRVLDFRALPTGQTRHLEGPSSDTSPQGNITFHRLRDYVPGDDLRLVHWRSSARTGKLVVKHNVDTSQPFSVVLLDIRPARYTAESFESAVDVAASVIVVSSANKAPVELRLTDSTTLGGPRMRDITPLIDHLTGATPVAEGQLTAQLLALRRAHGGTSLVVVTGVLDNADLPYVAALRRRFEQLVVVSIDPERANAKRPVPPPRFPGVRIIVAADADGACAAWNVRAPA